MLYVLRLPCLLPVTARAVCSGVERQRRPVHNMRPVHVSKFTSHIGHIHVLVTSLLSHYLPSIQLLTAIRGYEAKRRFECVP